MEHAFSWSLNVSVTPPFPPVLWRPLLGLMPPGVSGSLSPNRCGGVSILGVLRMSESISPFRHDEKDVNDGGDGVEMGAEDGAVV